ncbi:MAG: hypothetical protein HFH65_10840 [Lachnospiraceae bacterium]|nr:hypothetical protein [Lachnospiraceae bacterium]
MEHSIPPCGILCFINGWISPKAASAQYQRLSSDDGAAYISPFSSI